MRFTDRELTTGLMAVLDFGWYIDDGFEIGLRVPAALFLTTTAHQQRLGTGGQAYARYLFMQESLRPWVSLELDVAGTRLLMVHASPWKPFEDYIFPRSPTLPRFAQLPYDFVILGHTHVPMVERVDRVTVINPGSCAQPRDQDRRGSYAILDLERREVELRRVRLD